MCLGLLVDLTFNPFVQDVKYGNVSSFQLLYMAAMLTACAVSPVIWQRRDIGAIL